MCVCVCVCVCACVRAVHGNIGLLRLETLTLLRFLLISSPAIKAVPFVGFRSPVRILKVVVLPAPVNRKQTAAQSLVDITITINNDMLGEHHNNKQHRTII